MAGAPKSQSGISKIKLYTPGASGSGDRAMRKLSSNENLYGPSPMAKDAVRAAAENLWLYPSVDHRPLRDAIAEVHNLPAEQIICGGMGSDEILYNIAHAYAGDGDEIIMTAHGFEVYGIAAHAAGATLITVPETERRVDVDHILHATGAQTKIIFIANPANPTGTMLDTDELTRLADTIPSDCLLVIDSAYAEFAPGYDGGASLAINRKNVIMTRTFSKLYGLGGLRIGWALADQVIIDTLNRVRIPFNISAPALAGAEAAMRDQGYARECANKIITDRAYMTDALRQLGLQIDESFTNFILVRFADQPTAEDARAHLDRAGYVVRAVAHYGFPEALRISIGTHEDCQGIVAALGEFVHD